MRLLKRIHFLSQPEKLRPVREAVRTMAREQGCSEENLDCMVMAINEACMNVMQHAYHQIDDGEIVLEFWQQADELVIRIYDFAEKVDIRTIRSRDLDDVRPGGLGVHLIHKVMDKVEYIDLPEQKGNLLEMRKRIGEIKQCKIKCEADE